MEKNNINDGNNTSDVKNISENKYIIDMHCHPGIKPYSRCIKHGCIIDPGPDSKRSIWHYNPPKRFDKCLNRIATVTRFSQSNFSALSRGKVKIICASLYPIEHGFGSIRGRKGFWTDFLFWFISEISWFRIQIIQTKQNYYNDLLCEYEYYKRAFKTVVQVGGNKWKQALVKNFKEIETNMQQTTINIISVVLSIEGSHVFNCGMELPADPNAVLRKVDKVKNWEHRPLFISIAHHFYNELCGHAKSITGFLDKRLNQDYGMNHGFTNLGRLVVERLLDDSKGNKRIYIDIKHMSTESRRDYYDILESPKYEGIPIIVSHGAVNGLKSFDDVCLLSPIKCGKFNEVDINFFDCEIKKIGKSGGLFGLQLDERRIASKSQLLLAKGKIRKWKRLCKNSESCPWKDNFKKKNSKDYLLKNMALLVWYQIQHIAEVLDEDGQNAWGTAVIGSDFDGIVDPLDGYWTAKDLRSLEENLIENADNFLKNGGRKWKSNVNNTINGKTIIDKFLRKNAYEFLKNFYN